MGTTIGDYIGTTIGIQPGSSSWFRSAEGFGVSGFGSGLWARVFWVPVLVCVLRPGPESYQASIITTASPRDQGTY